MRGGFAGAMSVMLVGWAGVARAQEGPAGTPEAGTHKVAVIRLDVEGNVPPAAREILRQRLVEGLAAAAFEVSAGQGDATCAEAACYPALARSLGVSYLVAAKVKEQRKSYEIELDLINGQTGTSLGSRRERCEICGIEDAAEKMGLAASALRARLEGHVRTPARFIIRSRPSGANVRIDARPMGRTPLDATIASGEHQLSLSAAGYHPLDRSFTVVSGVDETLEYDLVRLPTKFPFKLAGWTGVVVGALAVAGGITALAIDSSEISCTPEARDDDGDCPRLRATKALAAILLGGGAVSATLGGVWLYLGSTGGGLTEGARAGRTSATSAGVVLNGRF